MFMNIKNNILKFSRVTSKQTNFSLIFKLILSLAVIYEHANLKEQDPSRADFEFCPLRQAGGKSQSINIYCYKMPVVL
jgi:hypothetical protein